MLDNLQQVYIFFGKYKYRYFTLLSSQTAITSQQPMSCDAQYTMWKGKCVGAYCLGDVSRWGIYGRNCSGECPRKLRRGNVKISTQDYKSLHVAVMICSSQVNTQRETAFDQLYY